MKFKKSSNIFTKGVISLIIFMLVISSFLFLPQKAQAQFIVTDVVKSVWDAIKWAWDKGGAVAYRNALNFFLQQAAKQSGEWLATGDPGKKPAFLTDPDFFNKAGDQMLGEFVDSVAGNFLGQSLCDTLDPTVKFNILANLDPEYQKMKWAEEPKCSFSQIKKNLEKTDWENMLEFSAEVKEGKVAKQKSSISTLIQSDSALTKDIKLILDGELEICPVVDNKPDCPGGFISCNLNGTSYFYQGNSIGIGALLHKYTNEFEDILSGLEKASISTAAQITSGDKGLEKAVENNAFRQEASERFLELEKKLKPETGTELWGGEGDSIFKLKFLNKWSSECLRKGSESLIDDVQCRGLCDVKIWLRDDSNSIKRCTSALGEPTGSVCTSNSDCESGSTCEEWYGMCQGGSHDGEWCKNTSQCLLPLPGVCVDAGQICYNRIERVNKYTKQLVEWTTTLQDMIVQVIANWEAQQNIPDLDPLEDAQNMFNPESSAMGIQMSLESKLFQKQTDAIEKSKFFRSIQGSMNAVTSKISGLVKLPSTFVSEKARESVKSGTAGPLTTTGVAFADAIGVFANTFMSQYMKTLFTKGLNPAADSSRVNVHDDEDETPDPDTTSILSEIKVIPINQTSNEMSIYDEFAICPSGIDQKYTSQFNCLLDNKLARAVEERMTIQEAMDNGLLNPGERLGIAGDTRSLLSKSHIQKLRLIGILPLGMQIASKVIIEGQYTNGMSLVDVVEGFDQRGADGICGNLDPGESEFCNLVDPNWVLKAPSYLCEITGYSAIPLRDSSFRQEACLDLKTCINESEGNQCDTWSYCTREKNIWRFGGDECDAHYNTCTSYTQKSNKEVFSYLSNTLDFDNCSLSNVGCKWYCSKWDQQYSGINGNWSCLSPGWRQYTCHLEGLCDDPLCSCTCNGDNGCPNGLGNCLMAEGSISCSLDRPELRNAAFFSNHIGECKESDEGCSEYIRIKSGAGVNFLPNGSFELLPKDDGTPFGWQINDSALVQQVSPSSGAQNSSNVVQIQAAAASVCELSQVVNNVPLQGDFIVSGYYKKNSVLSGDYNLKLQICYDDNCDTWDEAWEIIELDNNNWKYVSVSLSSDIGKSIDHIKIFAFDSLNFSGDIYIDTLQLRNETGNSVYREYGSKGITYLKSALEWMNCYDGDENNDDVNCENFVQKCESRDVGCELYTPINDNISDIPALVNNLDLCPSTCIGYKTFEEVQTNFVSSNRWVDLIPRTAKECSAPGCEEFTNLDALTQGGEAREYYTYLRQCVKTNAQGLAIVDSLGNEILPAAADTCQYYYTWVGEETNGYQLKKYYLEANPSLGGPVQVSATPNSDWGLCDEDHLDNPHCRQFYDAMGNIYYRLYKNTITCSMDCSPYRRSVDDATYMAIGPEGEVCNASDVGCREYKGAAYGNMKNLFLDRFIASADPWQNVEISDESINRLGQSIKADNNVAQRPVDDLIKSKGKVYSLSLWVKGSGDYIASFGNDLYFITEEPHNISVVSNEWQEIKFGSIYFNREPENDEKLIIQGPNHFYLDNIILNEIQDNVYLIKNSWNTPATCDIDSEGNIFSGYTLGCQAYWDRSHNARYLKSFSRLCPSEAVGCEAMIDTKNSISAFSEEFNSQSPQGDEIVIPSDSLIYRVYDTDKSCAAENKGCQRFGLPELDSNQKAIDFTDVYLLNNPDLYKIQSILCDMEGEGCQEYEGQIYFKEPSDDICEYRENVFINGENKNGWFKKETNHPCYIEDGFAYQPYGSVYGIRSNIDPLYEGIAGICPESQNGCTQFINPVEQNLILNTGFELGEDDDDIPYNWVAYAEPSQFYLESTDCLSGNCWGVDHTIADTSAGRQYIEIQPGSVYELSAWMKASDTSTGTSRIYLAYDDLNGNEVGFEFSEQLGHTDGKWIKHTVTLKAPYNAVFARILAPYVDGFMNVKIDNISLIEQNSPKGSYYYLNDNNIDRTSCNVMVGLKEGCVLFNDTSISGNLFYDSASTYVLSQTQGDMSVPASTVSLTSGGEGDSNVVLKVRRDRVCGEWLQCSGYRSVWDSSIDEFRSVCDSWVRCDQLIGSGKQAQCGHVVFDANPVPLTEEEYKSRNVSWSGMDYSGYSILNMYPIERLFPSEDTENPGLYTLTYFEDRDGDGIEENIGVDGIGLNIEKTTRIYPEKNAPFKASASTYYNKVNLCDSGGEDYLYDNFDIEGNLVSLYPDCQGSYQKAEYGDQYSGLTKYYNFDIDNVEDRKVCKYSGKYCTGNGTNQCDDLSDTCIFPNKITQVIGLRGFCLEPDESRPEDASACITWWPGASAGDVDVYNMHYSAGYVPAGSRKWYCLNQEDYVFLDVCTEDADPGCKYHCWEHDSCSSLKIYNVNDDGRLIHKDEIDYIQTELGASDGTSCSMDNIIYLREDHIGSYEEGNWYGCTVSDGSYAGSCGYDAANPDPLTCRCTQNGDGTQNDGCSCTKIQVTFDSNGFLEKVKLRAHGNSAANDRQSWDGDLEVHLKNGCQFLINAVPSDNSGLSIAYTNRLWEFSDYYSEIDPPNTPGTGDQDCIPYGVANTSDASRLTITGGLGEDNCDGGTEEGGKANIVYNLNGLQQLFVKVDNVEEFDKNMMDYNPVTTGNWAPWNITDIAASSADAPTISSIFGNLNAITIGEYDSGVGPEMSPFVANLKFYAWADTNHMPIREISVDWDDDTPVNFYNVISKNHRSECCETEINCAKFGLTPQACVDKYFSFNHTYTCEGQDSPGWGEYIAIDSDCANMCCFKPKVYIKDNWGWCAGTPKGVYVGWDVDNNAYNCKDSTNLNTGIPYNGVIKVNINN